MAFVMQEFRYSERRACELLEVDRSRDRYEPQPDHNTELRQSIIELAQQKPRYGYRRWHALLARRGDRASVQRVYRIYQRAGLAVRRLQRKRLARVTAVSAAFWLQILVIAATQRSVKRFSC